MSIYQSLWKSKSIINTDYTWKRDLVSRDETNFSNYFWGETRPRLKKSRIFVSNTDPKGFEFIFILIEEFETYLKYKKAHQRHKNLFDSNEAMLTYATENMFTKFFLIVK